MDVLNSNEPLIQTIKVNYFPPSGTSCPALREVVTLFALTPAQYKRNKNNDVAPRWEIYNEITKTPAINTNYL